MPGKLRRLLSKKWGFFNEYFHPVAKLQSLCSVSTPQTGSSYWDITWDGVQPSCAPEGAVPWVWEHSQHSTD